MANNPSFSGMSEISDEATTSNNLGTNDDRNIETNTQEIKKEHLLTFMNTELNDLRSLVDEIITITEEEKNYKKPVANVESKQIAIEYYIKLIDSEIDEVKKMSIGTRKTEYVNNSLESNLSDEATEPPCAKKIKKENKEEAKTSNYRLVNWLNYELQKLKQTYNKLIKILELDSIHGVILDNATNPTIRKKFELKERIIENLKQKLMEKLKKIIKNEIKEDIKDDIEIETKDEIDLEIEEEMNINIKKEIKVEKQNSMTVDNELKLLPPTVLRMIEIDRLLKHVAKELEKLKKIFYDLVQITPIEDVNEDFIDNLQTESIPNRPDIDYLLTIVALEVQSVQWRLAESLNDTIG